MGEEIREINRKSDDTYRNIQIRLDDNPGLSLEHVDRWGSTLIRNYTAMTVL